MPLTGCWDEWLDKKTTNKSKADEAENKKNSIFALSTPPTRPSAFDYNTIAGTERTIGGTRGNSNCKSKKKANKTQQTTKEVLQLQFIINGLITGVLYSLMAIGFSLVYNTTKVFHIAAAGIWAFATYMYFVLSNPLKLLPIVSIVLAIIICMALSLLIDFSVYRPLYRRKSSSGVAMIASIGVLTIINSLSKICSALNGWDTMTPESYKGFDIWLSFGNSDTEISPIIIGAIILVAFLLFLKYSGFGVQLRAMSSDNDMYAILGYNPMKTRTIAFLLSGMFIALSSCLLVGKNGGGVVMENDKSLDYFIYALAAMIIGGTGNYGACVLGGLLVGITTSILEGYKLSPWIGVAVFGLLILTLLFRPQGLIGLKQRSV